MAKENESCLGFLGGGTLDELAKEYNEKYSTPINNLIRFFAFKKNNGNRDNGYKLKKINFLEISQDGKKYYGTFVICGALAQLIAEKYHYGRTGWKALRVVILSTIAAIFPFLLRSYSRLLKPVWMETVADQQEITNKNTFLIGAMSNDTLANIQGWKIKPFRENKKDEELFSWTGHIPNQFIAVLIAIGIFTGLWKFKNAPIGQLELTINDNGHQPKSVPIDINGDTHLFFTNVAIQIRKIAQPITVLTS